jgi:hypothetical protein
LTVCAKREIFTVKVNAMNKTTFFNKVLKILQIF